MNLLILMFIFTIIALWLCNRIVIILSKKTGKRIFQKQQSHEFYPLFPNKYYKIAVYGGSAAAGYSAPVNFSTIINHEIGSRGLKERNPFVMNFSCTGMPFYNGQSIIAKEFMQYFDLTIIYAGNNEMRWALEDVIGNGNESIKHSVENWNSRCRWRFAKLRRLINGIKVSTHLTTFGFNVLERIYQIAVGRMAKISLKRMTQTNISDKETISNFVKFNMITSTPVIPPLEREKTIDLFVGSVEDVVDYASQIKRTVLVVGLVNNDLYSPTQSLMVGKTDDEIRIIEKTLLNLKEKIQKNINGTNAISIVSDKLAKIAEEYPELAIVNHLMALVMFKENRYEAGVQYLIKCFNEDYPIMGRVNERINSRLEKVCLSYKESTFVSLFGKFSQFLVDESEYNQLFTDFVHPSSLGHILIAEAILEYLGCQERSAVDQFDALVNEKNRFYDLLNVSDGEIIYNIFICFRWHLSCLINVSDKEQYLKKASDYLEKWWGLVYKGTCRSNYYFWKGIIAANYHDDMSVKKYFSKSKNINEPNFNSLISSRGANGVAWRVHLSKLGYVL